MPTSIVIIDDFLDNIDDFRRVANTLEYSEKSPTKKYISHSNKRVKLPLLEERISQILQEPVSAVREKGHGIFQLTNGHNNTDFSASIGSTTWMGVLNLNSSEQCNSQLNFLRHKASNTERALLEKEDLNTLQVSNIEAANKIFSDIINQDMNTAEKWDAVMQVPITYNRLLLFRPWLWHQHVATSGSSSTTAALDYLLFFDRR